MISSGITIYQDRRSFQDIVPALTDIKITKIQASAAMGMFATFDILGRQEEGTRQRIRGLGSEYLDQV